jgi:seryl-tRNA synthetase
MLFFVATFGLFNPALAQTYTPITPASATAEVPLTDYFGNEGFTVDDPQNAIDSNISTKWQGVTGNIPPPIATAEVPLTDYFGNEGFTLWERRFYC